MEEMVTQTHRHNLAYNTHPHRKKDNTTHPTYLRLPALLSGFLLL
jgi:hypothetical protein